MTTACATLRAPCRERGLRDRPTSVERLRQGQLTPVLGRITAGVVRQQRGDVASTFRSGDVVGHGHGLQSHGSEPCLEASELDQQGSLVGGVQEDRRTGRHLLEHRLDDGRTRKEGMTLWLDGRLHGTGTSHIDTTNDVTCRCSVPVRGDP